MLTGVTEITRNASSASRGLVMISSRLTQVLDESSSTGKKLTAIYKDLGIELLNEEGQLRSHYDILGELATKWNSLSENQQKYIALTSAGARQQQNFVALMDNWNNVANATATAYESVGSAQRENEKVIDSIAKKVEILRSEFQQSVIGDGGLQEFAKTILDIGIGVLDLISNLGGLPPILATITAYLIGINALNIYNSLNTINGAIQNIIYALPNALAAWRSYAAGVTAANTAMQASIPLVGWIAAAIGALVSIIITHNRHLAEQQQRIRDNIKAFSDEYNSLEEVQQKLQDENLSREELNKIIDSNLDEYDAERLKLLNINQARQEAIELIEQEKQARAQELVDTGLTEYEASLDRLKNGYSEVSDLIGDVLNASQSLGGEVSRILGETGLATAKTAEEQKKALVSFKNELVELRSKYDEGSYTWEKYNSVIQATEATLSAVQANIKEDTNIVDLFNAALSTLGLRYDETTQTVKEGSERWGETLRQQEKAMHKTEEAIGLTQEEKKELEALKNQYGITEDAIDEYREAHAEANLGYYDAIEAILAEKGVVIGAGKSIEELQEDYENLQKSTNGLVSSLKEVASALDEQEEQGSLNIETQLKLIDAGYALALSYDEETGACKINTEAVVEMAKAKIEAEIASQKVAQANLTSMLLEEANAATANAKAFLLRAQAMGASATADYVKRAEEKGYTSSVSGYGANWGYVAESESRKMYDAYDKTINALQSQLDDFEKNGVKAFGNIGNAASKAGKKGSSAAKDAKDAQKELNKELEDTKSKYEKVIKWITQQYDKEIEKIQKAKDEAIKAEEEKIKAKEEEKDAALDAIEAEIRALEKEKNALKEQKEAIDDRKQALKDEEDAIIDSIEKEIKALEKERDALLKPIEERIKLLEKERDAFIKSVETKIKALEKERDTLIKPIEERIEIVQKERDSFIDSIEEEIDALEEERDKIIDATQAEIDSVTELKDARKTYWDEQIDALKKANKELKDNLELQEKLDALEKAKNKKVKIYKEGQGFVYDVDQGAVQEAQKALDEYLSQKAYEDELERLENLKDAEIKNYNDRLNELNKYKTETKKSYDEQIKNLKAYKEDKKKAYDEEINNLKQYKENTKNDYDEQIDNLKEHKDETKANYDEEIDNLKTYKDDTKTNYDEQISNLKTYKETVQEYYKEQIKVLEQDINALEQHMSELDKHKTALEEHKDSVENSYEAEIRELNRHKEETEKTYEAEITTWQRYKQEFEDMVNAYEENQNRLLFEQLTGIDDESNNWMTRLSNLQQFVEEYNKLQAKLDSGETDIAVNKDFQSGSMSSYSGEDILASPSTTSIRTVTNNNTSTTPTGGDAQYTPSYNTSGTGKYGAQPKYTSAALEAARKRAANRHASGISSIGQDEIAIVGDSPNQELVIGSKLNGSLMSLDKGAGVVNAKSATTFAGMLNQVGKYGSSGFGSGGGTLSNNYNNDTLTINGVTIQGANIKDPQTFVNGLLNLKAEALQRAYSHK